MNGLIPVSGHSLFCMEEGDYRFQPMCCHYLSDSPCDDVLLGAEECTSPFETYEISIPIDENAPCQSSSSQITDKNCKGFDVSFSLSYTLQADTTILNTITRSLFSFFFFLLGGGRGGPILHTDTLSGLTHK